MRRSVHCKHKPRKATMWLVLLFIAVLLLFSWFNAYINTEIRPTLMQLAEYDARSETLQIIHEAVDQTMEQQTAATTELYRVTESGVEMDASIANRLRNALIMSVQEAMESAPERKYSIPFGSLTGNSLFSGHGPGWSVQWKPQGYVQTEWRENGESLSINTTRYSASLMVSVTVNMVLDGRTETLTVRDEIPLASLLLCGDTPSVYAASLD